MAENLTEQAPQILDSVHEDEDSDNESIMSNEPENSQQFSRLESELKDEMGAIATQVKETILGINQQMQKKFTELDKQIQSIETHLQDRNNNQGLTQFRNSTPMQLNSNSNMQTTNISNGNSIDNTDNSTNQMPCSHINFNLHSTNSTTDTPANTTQHTRADNYVKLKPQTFSGSDDDFEDFLTQFEITAEINGWNYKAKSLYLANSLTGAARAILNELTAEQRRDYQNLVQKLTERYGSENRAEVYRSQLKSRTKGKGETTAQLAQGVRKLTRQAYPNVSLDVVEALAVDHFIDAIPESEIRLTLREVGPSTLAEAERIAVRMESQRTADKLRTRFVGKVEQSGQMKGPQDQNTEQQMENISKRIDILAKSVQNLTHRQQFHTYPNARNFPPCNMNGNPRPNRPYNRNFHPQRQFQSRGGNPMINQQNNARPRGNSHQPVQGSATRLN